MQNDSPSLIYNPSEILEIRNKSPTFSPSEKHK